MFTYVCYIYIIKLILFCKLSKLVTADYLIFVPIKEILREPLADLVTEAARLESQIKRSRRHGSSRGLKGCHPDIMS